MKYIEITNYDMLDNISLRCNKYLNLLTRIRAYTVS